MRDARDEPNEHDAAELAALADGSLAPDRRAALEARVAVSPELAERLAEQRDAIGLIQAAGESVDAPPWLRARVEHQARRRAPRRRRLVLAAGAVAAVVAVAIGVVAIRDTSSGPQFQATLAASGLAPGATGDATLSRTDAGWRIYLEASGLPRLDSGRFYEAWLENVAGTRVAIGTFNDGQGVTLWAGVSPVAFPRLIITREVAGQPPSGQQVMTGTVATTN